MIIESIMHKFLYILKLKTIAWYDSTAEEYASFDGKNPQANLDIKIRIKRLISRKRPAFILDLGCGSGRYFPFLKGELIVGIDLSIGMLKHAKKHKNVNLIQADIYYLPFQKDIFDLIISMSLIGEYLKV